MKRLSPRVRFAGLLVTVCTPWVIIAVRLALTGLNLSSGPGDERPDCTHDSESVRMAHGRWGCLELVPVTVEMPRSMLRPGALLDAPLNWFVRNVTATNLAVWVASLGVTPATRAVLTHTPCRADRDGVVLAPSPETVRRLPPNDRARLYAALADDLRNLGQSRPLTFAADTLEQRCARSGLTTATLDGFRGLLYPRGSDMLFADAALLLRSVPSGAERLRLVGFLARGPSLLLKLHVKPNESVTRLVAYWDTGGMAKDLIPLLESLTRTREAFALDVMHLLTPFGRELLHDRPRGPSATFDNRDASFWAAANFFAVVPDETLGNEGTFVETVDTLYYPIAGAPAFGDVVVFIGHEQLLHAAVYMADDVVFTTRPGHVPSPFVFLRMSDIEHVLSVHAPIHTTVFRKRDQ